MNKIANSKKEEHACPSILMDCNVLKLSNALNLIIVIAMRGSDSRELSVPHPTNPSGYTVKIFK